MPELGKHLPGKDWGVNSPALQVVWPLSSTSPLETPQRQQADCPDPEGGVSDPFHML